MIWVIGRVLSIDGWDWEFCGVFDDKQSALNFCTDDSYFIGPAKLNEIMPDVTIEWPGAWFPKSEEEPDELS